MFHKRTMIAAAGLLSVIAGLCYMLEWPFDFGFLGHEQGSERTTVEFWGRCSAIIGIALLAALLLRSKMRESINDGQLVLLLAILFVLQLPAFGSWLLVLALGGVQALYGVAAHTLLLACLCAAMLKGGGLAVKPAS